uniref:Glycosyltransferase n=1 Tax=Schlesneria paludicola TaxID=360056 RepID=A0A7C4QMJ5_9PLAN
MTDVPLSAFAADAGASSPGVAGAARSVAESLARPIRLAYVVHGFDVGGIERCVARLVNHLDPERFQPAIICLTRSGKAAEWITRRDVPIFELQKRPGNDWSAVRRLSRLLRQQQFHIVHSHNWGTLIETTLARRWAGVPVHVHTEHGQGHHYGLRRARDWIRRCARRWAFGRLNQLVACAESVRDFIHHHTSLPLTRIHFLPNGVDPPPADFRHAVADRRSELGIRPSAFVFGSTGRLVAVKNYRLPIDALAFLRGRGVDGHFLLVGDGPEEPLLRRHAETQGVAAYVHFVGHHADVYPWLALCDAYVNSSDSEAMSLSILEAMAARLPLVVTDVGDNRLLTLAFAVNGLVVPPQAPESMARALQNLAADRNLCRDLSANAYATYQRYFTTDICHERHVALYDNLLSHARAHR